MRDQNQFNNGRQQRENNGDSRKHARLFKYLDTTGGQLIAGGGLFLGIAGVVKGIVGLCSGESSNKDQQRRR